MTLARLIVFIIAAAFILTALTACQEGVDEITIGDQTDHALRGPPEPATSPGRIHYLRCTNKRSGRLVVDGWVNTWSINNAVEKTEFTIDGVNHKAIGVYCTGVSGNPADMNIGGS